MLINFSVENFKSFKEKANFSLIAAPYKRHSEHVFVSDQDSVKVLRGASLYGNNGAGKTNLLEALFFLKRFVVNGTNSLNETIFIPKFKLDIENSDKPTTFTIDFFNDDKRYFYEISLNDNKVLKEELFVYNNNKEQEVFSRELNEQGKTILSLGDSKRLTQKDKLKIEIYSEELRNNQPFLLEGYNKNIPELASPIDWFQNKLKVFLNEEKEDGLAFLFHKKPRFRDIAHNIIHMLNIGIEEVKTESIPLEEFFGQADNSASSKIKLELIFKESLRYKRNNTDYTIYQDEKNQYVVSKIYTLHRNDKGNLVKFELNEESFGTRQLLNLLPSVIDGVLSGKVFVLDEIESSIHPILIRKIISIFLEAGSNFKGQLIFTTHESNLLDLDIFRQDEIWFAEKETNGNTKLYSLNDFKPRYDKDIQKGYLEGQFSFIPFLSNTNDLNWNSNE